MVTKACETLLCMRLCSKVVDSCVDLKSSCVHVWDWNSGGIPLDMCCHCASYIYLCTVHEVIRSQNDFIALVKLAWHW